MIVTLGPRSTTSYSLRVLTVGERAGRVVVSVLRRNATLARPGTPQVTFPHVLLAVPLAGGPVRVHFVER